MSQANYNFTVTRSARIALALKRLYSRRHIALWSHEPVSLVPSPSPRVSTPLQPVLASPSGTVAWIGGKTDGYHFVPERRTTIFTTADLHPRARSNTHALPREISL